MKYDLIIEQSLRTTSLKRIRVKVDPSLVSKENDLSKCHGYEGYVLEECGDVPKVLVVSPEFSNGMSVMGIPSEYLESMPEDNDADILNQLKLFVLQKRNFDLDSPEAQQIAKANSIEEIESILKTTGLTDDDVKVLYRKFILDENVNLFNEISLGGMLRAVGKTTSGLGKVYSALGGERGGALLQGVGGSVSAAGTKLANRKNKNPKIERILKQQQDAKLLPIKGEYISAIIPGDKTPTRLQVSDITASGSINQDGKSTGSVQVIAVPLKQDPRFDTTVIDFKDINTPLKQPVSIQYYKNNAITRIPSSQAMITRKDHDPVFGSKLSWQLRPASLKQKDVYRPVPDNSVYTDRIKNRTYIFLGVEEGGWAPYNLTTKEIGTTLDSSARQKQLSLLWHQANKK